MIRAAVAALVLFPIPAFAYLADNNLHVQGDASGFEVRASPGMASPAAWCAAGDYAIHILGVDASTQIWRTSEPPRRAGQGISFSLAPDRAASKSGLIQFGPDDAALSAAAASAFCWDTAAD